ncbi:hypothetical protein GCM10025789_06750 [Tessaracoccus lubricantis]|uniref:Uncharacterized protein n=1 Tax=Tessaracoccus lubricantis TaxID=545543 RepID=A0ABP9F1S1_9ACTN
MGALPAHAEDRSLSRAQRPVEGPWASWVAAVAPVFDNARLTLSGPHQPLLKARPRLGSGPIPCSPWVAGASGDGVPICCSPGPGNGYLGAGRVRLTHLHPPPPATPVS